MESESRAVPVLLWPLIALWRLLALVLIVTGRLVAGFLGLALMTAGLALSATIVGAPLGIAAVAIGFLLLLRAIF